MSNDNKDGEKTLRTLLTIAGFVVGATSVIAWNKRDVLKGKVVDAKERSKEFKEKVTSFAELVNQKLVVYKTRKTENESETPIENPEAVLGTDDAPEDSR